MAQEGNRARRPSEAGKSNRPPVPGLKLRYDEDPMTVVCELVDLAQEASGTNLQPGPFPPKPRKG
jgi:hypothetical protein